MDFKNFLGGSKSSAPKIIKGRVSLARVNRDPGAYMDVFRNKLDKHGTGLASGSVSTGSHYGVAANRGETSDKSLQTRDVNKSINHRRVNF